MKSGLRSAPPRGLARCRQSPSRAWKAGNLRITIALMRIGCDLLPRSCANQFPSEFFSQDAGTIPFVGRLDRRLSEPLASSKAARAPNIQATVQASIAALARVCARRASDTPHSRSSSPRGHPRRDYGRPHNSAGPLKKRQPKSDLVAQQLARRIRSVGIRRAPPPLSPAPTFAS